MAPVCSAEVCNRVCQKQESECEPEDVCISSAWYAEHMDAEVGGNPFSVLLKWRRRGVGVARNIADSIGSDGDSGHGVMARSSTTSSLTTEWAWEA
jgi:hypothetical protein